MRQEGVTARHTEIEKNGVSEISVTMLGKIIAQDIFNEDTGEIVFHCANNRNCLMKLLKGISQISTIYANELTKVHTDTLNIDTTSSILDAQENISYDACG